MPVPKARAWRGPELIEEFKRNAYSAQVAVDPQGNITAVWRQDGNGIRSEGAGSNRFEHGSGAWSDATFLDDGQYGAEVPTLATDGVGNVLVVWQQPMAIGPVRQVFGTRFDSVRGSWEPPALIARADSDGMIDPQVGLGSAGDGVVVWLRSKLPLGHSLHFARYLAGAWQSPEELVRQQSGNPGYPRLAVDGNGNAVVAWVEHEGPHMGFYVRRMSGSDGSWSKEVRLASEPCYLPTLTMSPSGEGLLAWTQSSGASSVLHVAHYAPEQDNWREEPLPGLDSAAPNYPTDALAGSLGFLVWKQGKDGSEVMVSQRTADGVWQSPRRLASDAGPYAWPKIAGNGSGAIATWVRGPETTSHVVAVRYDPASDTWGEAVVLDNGAGLASDPQIASNAAGLAVVVWQQRTPSESGHLWANRWE